jgi:hypothetical protein
MRITFIYELIDPITFETRYIGKANNPKFRFISHLIPSALKKNTYKNNWIKFLKKQNLKPILNIIDEVLFEEWEFWERFYIELYKGWNCRLTNGDNGGWGPGKFSEETKLKMSLAKKGKPSLRKGTTCSQETCLQMSSSRKGKTYEEIYGEDANMMKEKRSLIRKDKSYEEIYGEDRAKDIRNKQSLAIHPGHVSWNKGLTYSQESKDKMSLAAQLRMTEDNKEQIRKTVAATCKKKKEEGYRKKNEKRVKQIDIVTGEILKVWYNCPDAEEIFGNRLKGNIRKCAHINKNNGNKSVYGFKWEFEEN